MLYRDACSRLLDFDVREIFYDEGEVHVIRGEWIAKTRMYYSIHIVPTGNKICGCSDAPGRDHKPAENIILCEIRRYLCYGMPEAKGTRQRACKVAGWQPLQKEYWTEIDRKLVLERRVLKGANAHIEMPYPYSLVLESGLTWITCLQLFAITQPATLKRK